MISNNPPAPWKTIEGYNQYLRSRLNRVMFGTGMFAGLYGVNIDNDLNLIAKCVKEAIEKAEGTV